MFTQQCKKNKNGVALLFTVVVIGITGFAVMAFIAQSGILSIRNSQLQESGTIAQSLLYGCVDEVIAQHLHDIDFNDATISLGNSTCSIMVIDQDSEQKEMKLSVSLGGSTQSIFIIIDLVPVSLLSIHK